MHNLNTLFLLHSAFTFQQHTHYGTPCADGITPPAYVSQQIQSATIQAPGAQQRVVVLVPDQNNPGQYVAVPCE